MSVSVAIDGLTYKHTGAGPYVARSASDRDSNWPVWIIVDQIGFNGFSIEEIKPAPKFLTKEAAIFIAGKFNEVLR